MSQRSSKDFNDQLQEQDTAINNLKNEITNTRQNIKDQVSKDKPVPRTEKTSASQTKRPRR